MKTFIILMALIALSGCTTFQRIVNPGAMTNDELAAYRAKIQAQRQAKIDREENLKMGQYFAEIKADWGQCDKLSYRQGEQYCWYENEGDPMFLIFDKTNQLTGWYVDEETIRYRKLEEQNRELKYQQDRAAWAAAANAGKK